MKHWWIGPLLQMPAWLFMSLHYNWTPRFPRAWSGRRVTVCNGRYVHKVKMERVRKSFFEQWSLNWNNDNSPPPRAFFYKDEGITWCMGWSGKHVDALRVAAALAVLES